MKKSLTLDVLKQLINFNTTSINSNLELMDYITKYLNSYGVESTLIFDTDGKKANLFATIGPTDIPGVMLSGHTDTVPVTGQNWTKEPYILSEENGCFFGRGTSDMKGFIAAVLGAIPNMVSQKLLTPIHLAFSYDEEIGCIGVRSLIDMLKSSPVKPAVCIIGEPTSMNVVTSHKGKLAAKVTVIGKECHSGMAPYGVNAINYAARLVSWLENVAINKQANGPFEDCYEIPYSTVHTGVISGGNALNIVPKHCSFLFEIRNIAAEDPKHILAEFQNYCSELTDEMQKNDVNCKIDIEITTEYPGLNTPESDQAVTFVRKLAQSTRQANINFGTEGGLFSHHLGIPTVVCGPGSMNQGHKPDEYIHGEQLIKCEEFIDRLILELSTNHDINLDM
ncbi:acetylornithine deacetylase [Psychromonas sp. SR45-3]|uniref:acetylornithine deacetylase n=1 Tax=Psychromonas sp. SR45-3 TaxID=2760930 RepID=UPI0015FC9362|nr:acetylornithine deacetylase [Psychromonas sp. SR45-3]MBB1271345.1 acetylornithine deacetylase [Psychromonas sp. SR45-3]